MSEKKLQLSGYKILNVIFNRKKGILFVCDKLITITKNTVHVQKKRSVKKFRDGALQMLGVKPIPVYCCLFLP